MARKEITNQLYYTGKGYLDAKMQPVKTLMDLNLIQISHRFIGLTVTVLDDGSGKPQDYWIESNVRSWVKKNKDGNNSLPLSGNDVENV